VTEAVTGSNTQLTHLLSGLSDHNGINNDHYGYINQTLSRYRQCCCIRCYSIPDILYYIWQSLVWTPLSFVYIVEILSYSTRSSGLAAFQGACYITGFLNLYAIPYAIGWSSWGFYLITAAICFLEAIVVFFYWPETRGLTLEEIDVVFDGEKHYENELTINEVEQVMVDVDVGKA
jgi:magnesium-transporting ATPase (P-type)